MTVVCDRPAAGWTCPRGLGHDGPCAASPEFQRATDQVQAARDMFAEVFGEDDVQWLVAEGRTREQALETVTAIEPEMPAQSARLVRGWLGRYGYDAFFKRDKNGPVEMWQVEWE